MYAKPPRVQKTTNDIGNIRSMPLRAIASNVSANDSRLSSLRGADVRILRSDYRKLQIFSFCCFFSLFHLFWLCHRSDGTRPLHPLPFLSSLFSVHHINISLVSVAFYHPTSSTLCSRP
ncbi:hypothetical protein DL89DRAFT_31367 [Linderina pennispora]|uniref:Uncharacterized protein n=1 Tax=Linderina pennispora TaxID=61395 RepID=A0A1Y1W4B9_9FUNG|nr:uncharacterized protein DL89DRAFT_31367 [Linderina pennispora]ORX68317.1 hypothetical protein DL89DRAFT_31367 [Linderina pennispora]